jgi:hypothetical protein
MKNILQSTGREKGHPLVRAMMRKARPSGAPGPGSARRTYAQARARARARAGARARWGPRTPPFAGGLWGGTEAPPGGCVCDEVEAAVVQRAES